MRAVLNFFFSFSSVKVFSRSGKEHSHFTVSTTAVNSGSLYMQRIFFLLFLHFFCFHFLFRVRMTAVR